MTSVLFRQCRAVAGFRRLVVAASAAVALAFVCGLLSTQMVLAQTTRQLDAHEHGHSTLNIAVEGMTVSMELEAPGADIVGFEHTAASDADKVRVAKAKIKLEKPLALFEFPMAAGCSVADVSVEIEGNSAHADDNPGHTEFHATYTLTCKNPREIELVKIPFFDQFPGAAELEVNLISNKGQRQFEIERDKPRLDLSGLI